MLFQCNEQQSMDLFRGEYFSKLFSDDLLDSSLPFTKYRAKGGTMVLWKRSLDQYITVWTAHVSPSFLPLVFSYPGCVPTIHITIYLPTSGKDAEFIEVIAKLDNCIQDMTAKHPETLIFIRGDANVNRKDRARNSLLSKLCQDWDLKMVDIPHPTYHHFTGDGASDSHLDVLIHSTAASEQLSSIFCKLEDPLITSHHDILLSSFQLPHVHARPADHDNPLAPSIPNTRVKIQWSEPGIREYKAYIDENLARMRTTWLNSSSPACFSVLIQSTNAFLNLCAKSTNKYIDLGKESKQKSCSKPRAIARSEKRILAHFKVLKNPSNVSIDYNDSIVKIKEEKRRHRRLLRLHQVKKAWSRDKYLDRLISDHPSSAYQFIKKSKFSRTQKVNKMHVGNRTYRGDTVPDGIFESIRCLKTEPTPINMDPSVPLFDEEYKHILDICKSGRKIPEMSREKSTTG